MAIRLIAFVVALGAALIAAPVAIACGPHEHHRHGGGGGGGGGGHGGHHGHHGGGGGGGGVDVGVDVEPGPDVEDDTPTGVEEDPGYGNGRIGPQTAACAELSQRLGELNQLIRTRRQVASGDAAVFRDMSTGHQRVMHGMNANRERNRDNAVGDLITGDNPATSLQQNEQFYDSVRDSSLARVDAQISATQDRVGQLRYDCPE